MHAGPTLIAEGTDDQRRAHLPGILRGDAVWCQGFSEPGAGSDLASLATRAERDGDDYVVSGQKIWSTRAHVADYCELLVRTDPAASKHKGITWLILDMHQPGVRVRPMRTLDGESHFCELFLDEARVPATNRVGAENDGWRVANVTLRFERGTAFAQHIITMRSQLRKLVALALARRSEPGAGWDSDAVRAQVGRLEASVEALWRMTQMCISEAERTGAPAPFGSAVKLRYSELGQEIAELALRLAGEPIVGRTDEEGVATAEIVREYLWSLQYTIAAGTSQIQRNLIAERILGLPKGR
jgi:alkylation response protein AidB-like acyl-CoA dehydrogenase